MSEPSVATREFVGGPLDGTVRAFESDMRFYLFEHPVISELWGVNVPVALVAHCYILEREKLVHKCAGNRKQCEAAVYASMDTDEMIGDGE